MNKCQGKSLRNQSCLLNKYPGKNYCIHHLRLERAKRRPPQRLSRARFRPILLHPLPSIIHVTKNQKEQENDIICSICFEDICDYKTSCNHEFHERCIQPWLRSNNTCPNCRTVINPSIRLSNTPRYRLENIARLYYRHINIFHD